MKKKTWKLGTIGFLLGCFTYLMFAVAVSLRMNTGEFYFALPALVKAYGNELFAVLIQLVTFSWLGGACGVAYRFLEDVELTPAKQGTGYLLSVTVGMLPLAWTGRWLEHPFVGIFSYLLIAAAVSLLLSLIGFVKLKRDVGQIKRAIGIGKEDCNEKR